MRDLTQFNAHRCRDLEAKYGAAWLGPAYVDDIDEPRNGIFLLRLRRGGCAFLVFASTRGGWDHLSIRISPRPKRCPTWDEMEAIKRTFFQSHEDAMQLHVPKSQHVNVQPYCLHLWRPQHVSIPRPPAGFV